MASPHPHSLPLDAESLLAHSAWLAGFARALVANPADVDDVVQQTYVRALEHPPKHRENLRGWLGTIARNVVRSGARSDTARVARESVVAPMPPAESPIEAVERTELRRSVVEAVLALAEPYRSAVMLRFFEEQDVASVARLTGSGEETVRTRLRRGVQQVRERLERKAGERARSTEDDVAARALLFVQLRELAASADSPAASSSAAHSLRLRIVRRSVVGPAAVLAGVAIWRFSTPRAPPTDVKQETARQTPPDTGSREVPPPPAVVASRETEAARPSEAPVAAPEPARRTTRLGSIRGTVRDADGNPVEGAYVWALDCPAHRAIHSMPTFGGQAKLVVETDPARQMVSGWVQTRSGKGGAFELEGLSVVPAWEVGAYDPALGAVVTDVHEFDRDHHDLVVDVQLVRGSKVHGDVQDEGGNPIGGARIYLFSTCGQKKPVRSNFVANRVGSAIGAFDAGFQCGDKLEVACTAPGFQAIQRSGFERANGKVNVVHLRTKRLPGSLMRGSIVDPAGHSVDFEALLRARFIQERADLRSLKATVWAIASDAKPSAVLVAGDSGGPGVFEGRIDFAESKYEVVVPADFRGSVEVRVFRSVFGSAAVDDVHAPPVVTCDEAKLPADELPTTFAVRFVDSETKEPIDLEHESSLPQATDKASFVPIVAARSDARHGLVTYRCLPGPLDLEPILEGYAYHSATVDVPREQPSPPMSMEMTPARSGVHGFVLRSDGRPLGLAALAVYRRSGSGWLEETGPLTRANADGEFEFDRLTKGDHVLVVSAQPDEAPGIGSFIASAPFPELTVRATPGRTVRFRVVAPPTSGQIVQGAFHILDGHGLVVEDITSRWSSLSSSDDEITLKLEDGHYTADFERLPYRLARFEFDVPAGKDVEIPLTLPPDRTK